MKIEDNTVDFERYKQIKSLKKFAPQIMAGALFVLLIAIFFLSPLLRFVLGSHIEGAKVSIEADQGLSFEAAVYDNDIAILNSQGFLKYDWQANLVWAEPVKLQNPILYGAGRYALLSDKGGRDVVLIYKNEVKHRLKTNEPIQFATVNASGFFAVVMEESGYKSLVSVYNNKGEEVFKWYSAKNYIMDVDIAPDNKAMVISSFDSEQNTVTSKVSVFDFKSTSPLSENLHTDNLVFDIKFLGRNSIVALGDKKTVCTGKSGESKWEIEYSGRQMHTYDIDDPNFLVFAMSRVGEMGVMGGGSEISVFNAKGKQIGNYETEGKITSLNQSNGTIVYHSKHELGLVSKSGRKLSVGETPKLVSGVKLLQNRLIAISGASVDIFKIKLGR